MFIVIRYATITFMMLMGLYSSNHIKATSIAKLPTEGVAAFFDDQFQGRTTASGEIYDMNSLTCAHPNLPFGTFLKVTNLSNQKSVVVRVNDRGPFVDSHELDLTLAAAKQLGMSEGICSVRMELSTDKIEFVALKKDSLVTQIAPLKLQVETSYYTCQIGIFSNGTNAENVVEKCENNHLPVFTENIKINQKYATKIMVGRLKTKNQAESLALDLKKLHFDNVIVKRI